MLVLAAKEVRPQMKVWLMSTCGQSSVRKRREDWLYEDNWCGIRVGTGEPWCSRRGWWFRPVRWWYSRKDLEQSYHVVGGHAKEHRSCKRYVLYCCSLSSLWRGLSILLDLRLQCPSNSRSVANQLNSIYREPAETKNAEKD